MTNVTELAKIAGVPVKVRGASASTYAIVRDGVVVNVTHWDSQEAPDWKPADGEAIACGPTVAIGHAWDGSVFADPTPPPAVPSLGVTKEKLVAMIDRAFREASAGLFVDDEKREQMRSTAMAAVSAVDAAETIEDATVTLRTVVADLETSAERRKL